MAPTAPEPNTALVIDLQKGILSFPAVEVLGRAASLAKSFRACGLPVVLVDVTRERQFAPSSHARPAAQRLG